MKTKHLFLFLIYISFISNLAAQQTSRLKDKRDDKSYLIVKINNQWWMAENLNYKTSGSWCYANNEKNCEKYGRLYEWDAAINACPTGWHLPTEDEWQELELFMDGSNIAGLKLKSKDGWKNNGNGSDEFNFSAIPGGARSNLDNSFEDIGSNGYWWTATENYSFTSLAWQRSMSFANNSLKRYHGQYKAFGLSVRCVKD